MAQIDEDIVSALDVTIEQHLDTLVESLLQVADEHNISEDALVAACFEFTPKLAEWMDDHIIEQQMIGNR